MAQLASVLAWGASGREFESHRSDFFYSSNTMKAKERLDGIIDYFKIHMAAPETELYYHSEYQLAVAVILSAQCTDKRVNIITPPLFERFPDFNTMATATHEEVFEYIKSCSYPNNKTKHLIGLAQKIIEEYEGKLPEDTKTLMSLPGIGRKTAHVLLSVLKNADVLAVDTHVFRVSHRIGLVNSKAKTPLEVEKQIIALVTEPNILHKLHHWLILHGRYVCIARKPNCEKCGIAEYCKYFSKNKV